MLLAHWHTHFRFSVPEGLDVKDLGTRLLEGFVVVEAFFPGEESKVAEGVAEGAGCRGEVTAAGA